MGYMRHHAVPLTSWDDHTLTEAHSLPKDLLLQYEVSESVLSPVTAGASNGYRSFAVFPDGSKEGWRASAEGDGFRGTFVEYLDAQRHSDGSSNLDWCVVQYGDDDNDNRM